MARQDDLSATLHLDDETRRELMYVAKPRLLIPFFVDSFEGMSCIYRTEDMADMQGQYREYIPS